MQGCFIFRDVNGVEEHSMYKTETGKKSVGNKEIKLAPLVEKLLWKKLHK